MNEPIVSNFKQPFEGEHALADEIETLIGRHAVRSVFISFEHTGMTAKWFAQRAQAVFAAFDTPEHYEEARALLSDTPNVMMFLGPSVNIIENIMDVVHGPILFYLNHVPYKARPIMDELATLSVIYNMQRNVFVVPDCKVPRTNLSYSKALGQDLTWNMIEPIIKSINSSFKHHFATKKSGAMRGAVYIYP